MCDLHDHQYTRLIAEESMVRMNTLRGLQYYKSTRSRIYLSDDGIFSIFIVGLSIPLLL